MRILLAAVVLSCGAASAASAQQADSTKQSGQPAAVTVLVVNRTTDELRVSGRGASSVRITAGSSGCVKLRGNSGDVVLNAEIVGSDVGVTTTTRPAGSDEPGGSPRGTARRRTMRSEAFAASAAPAWEWTIAGYTADQAQVVPAATACSN
ncbi:MAG TPA: hypothetical protein VF584_01190 [Longimicrobium sp.]|jgi:hypothetical protein